MSTRRLQGGGRGEGDRVKILKIETVSSCIHCPSSIEYFDYKTKGDKYRCLKTKRRIYKMLSIPSWCPLEDYKEVKDGFES